MKRPALWILALWIFGFPLVLSGADIRVDPEYGDDRNDGISSPVQSISRGIHLARPGDTVHLKEGVYSESAVFSKRHGTRDQPIILDGHGATLDGSEKVTSDEWESIGEGLFRRVRLYPKTNDAIVGRWFLLWDGRMQRMGRCLKGPSQPLKEAGQLQPGEWTYVGDEDAFYLKLAPGEDLDAANIRYPKRSSAVIFSREGSWITIRNLTGRHVYNDGFNVHGAQRNLRFDKIRAIQCGDDGFSAHEDAECEIDGFVSIGNGTGLCDTGTSRTHYTNLYIRDCVGFDLYFIGREHSIQNAVIESSAAKSFWLDGDHLEDGGQCRLEMRNFLIRRTGDQPQELRIGRGGFLHAMNCTFEGLNVTLTPSGGADFRRCAFLSGTFHPEIMLYRNTIWNGQGNLYDIHSLRVVHTSYSPTEFSEFQKFTSSEAGSAWQKPGKDLGDVGVDPVSIENFLLGIDSSL